MGPPSARSGSGSPPQSLSDFEQNRAFWDRHSDEYQQTHREHIGRSEPRWGMWQLPESELQVLGDVAGKDILELGCGAAQWSILLAGLGARPVVVDNSERQLEHARDALAAAGLDFPLVHAPAETVPLPDASFDIVFADHGANRFADPYAWVPEAARLLRPGGHLVFLVNGTIMILCSPDEELPPGRELLRPYFGMHRFEWDGTGGIEFHLGYGEWISLLRENGFAVENLIEIQAPPEGEPHRFPGLPDREWARRWPSEEIWVARKRS